MKRPGTLLNKIKRTLEKVFYYDIIESRKKNITQESLLLFIAVIFLSAKRIKKRTPVFNGIYLATF